MITDCGHSLASPAPLGTHRATNEDYFDPGFYDANSFPAPSQFSSAATNEYGYVSDVPQQDHQITNDGFLGRSLGHADSPSVPSQALWATYHLREEALVDPTFYSPDWSSAPLQTLHRSHHFADEGYSETKFDSSFAPLPVPQGPCRFPGGELSNPILDLPSAPLLSHDGAHTAVDDGHFEPILGSVEGITGTVYDEQFNVFHDGVHTAIDGHFEPILGSVEGASDTMYDELLGINPSDAINGLRGLDGFASTTDPTPEMTNSPGITTQRNGTALTGPSLPATHIAPNAANTHSSGDRISCTHVGCSATFGRAGDFRRHIKKHADPELSCSVKTCNYKSYRLDKLREHQRKRHGIAT